MQQNKHDLTTSAGVFAYLTERTNFFKPVENDFFKIISENTALKEENEILQTQIDTLALEILTVLGV